MRGSVFLFRLFSNNSSNLHSSQYRSGVDGVQYPKYVIQLGPLPTGSPLCLHRQEGEKKYIFNMFTHIPSLQLVTNLPDSNKGGAKGHVLVRGLRVGFLKHSERDFYPNYSLKLPGRGSS